MKRGFTIIEMLVASLLLGMLVSILTMMFSQSSISWRTGSATIADLDEVRGNIGALKEESDNVYIWNNEAYRIVGLWDENGQLRQRAWDVEGASDAPHVEFLNSEGLGDDTKLNDFKPLSVGSAKAGRKFKPYSVNFKSAGPNRNFRDYDDIWSYPNYLEIR